MRIGKTLKVAASFLVLCGALVVVYNSIRHRVKCPLTIHEGRGISNFMSLDNNPLWTFLGNFHSSTYDGRRLLVKDFGLEWINLRRPMISACVNPQSRIFSFPGAYENMKPFRGFEPHLGKIDQSLNIARVVETFGALPLVDCETGDFIFDRLTSCNYPMALRYDSSDEGDAVVQWGYSGRGISFVSCHGMVDEIKVYQPRMLDTEMVRSEGRLVLGIEDCFDMGKVECTCPSVLIFNVKNVTGHDVRLKLENGDQRLLVFLGVRNLPRDESTVVAIAVMSDAAPGDFSLPFVFKYADGDNESAKMKFLVTGSLVDEES